MVSGPVLNSFGSYLSRHVWRKMLVLDQSHYWLLGFQLGNQIHILTFLLKWWGGPYAMAGTAMRHGPRNFAKTQQSQEIASASHSLSFQRPLQICITHRAHWLTPCPLDTQKEPIWLFHCHVTFSASRDPQSEWATFAGSRHCSNRRPWSSRFASTARCSDRWPNPTRAVPLRNASDRPSSQWSLGLPGCKARGPWRRFQCPKSIKVQRGETNKLATHQLPKPSQPKLPPWQKHILAQQHHPQQHPPIFHNSRNPWAIGVPAKLLCSHGSPVERLDRSPHRDWCQSLAEPFVATLVNEESW